MIGYREARWSHAAASTFPAFKNLPQGDDPNELLASLSKSEMRELLEVAFERYYETSGLFGTPARAAEMVARLKEAGVDEVACLVDFGVPSQQVFEGLERLAERDAPAAARIWRRAPSAGDLIIQGDASAVHCPWRRCLSPTGDALGVREPGVPWSAERHPGDLATSLITSLAGESSICTAQRRRPSGRLPPR
jgi:hypothetical protein